MIYTITLNPSLDYVLQTDTFVLGNLNRTDQGCLSFGGKGINVSYILRQLYCESIILGFVAGGTGELLQQFLRNSYCQADFVTLPEGMTRINIKLNASQETEINAAGPKVDIHSLERLYKKIDTLRGSSDMLVISGSVPASMPNDTYEQILRRLEGTGPQFVIDTTGQQLINTLKFQPFLIKPNHHELGELFGCVCDSPDIIIDCARRLQGMGAQNILVSRAGAGAMLIAKDGRVLTCPAPHIKVVNSSGAGDAMLAGFLGGYCGRGKDMAHALRLAIACGSSTASTRFLAGRSDILSLLEQVAQVEDITSKIGGRSVS